MTDTRVPTPCVLDHPMPGRHRDDCTGTTTHPGKHQHPDRPCWATPPPLAAAEACPGCRIGPCPGCVPALADDRLAVCRWHAGRVQRALGDVPDLIDHLHELIEPGSGAGEERVTRGELAPPAPLSVDALSAADGLATVVRYWSAKVATERRLAAFLAPNEPRSRRDRQADDARSDVQRLILHTDHALAAPWAAAYVHDLTREVSAVRNRYPLEERPVFLPVPCPACGATSLARWAPRWAGAPTTIACELDDCRTVVDEDRYPWLVRLAADLARERKPA